MNDARATETRTKRQSRKNSNPRPWAGGSRPSNLSNLSELLGRWCHHHYEQHERHSGASICPLWRMDRARTALFCPSSNSSSTRSLLDAAVPSISFTSHRSSDRITNPTTRILFGQCVRRPQRETRSGTGACFGEADSACDQRADGSLRSQAASASKGGCAPPLAPSRTTTATVPVVTVIAAAEPPIRSFPPSLPSLSLLLSPSLSLLLLIEH